MIRRADDALKEKREKMINNLNSGKLQKRVKEVVGQTEESVSGERHYNKIFNSKIRSCNTWYNNVLYKVLFYSLSSI